VQCQINEKSSGGANATLHILFSMIDFTVS
jgi:hypothetical protein